MSGAGNIPVPGWALFNEMTSFVTGYGYGAIDASAFGPIMR